jgi:AraC family transcriptional regulator, exoenzyme S synthesis regulatory protein ExsA
MILKRQVFEFSGRPLMEKLTIRTPFKYRAIFPEEACFLHFRKGSITLNSSENSSEIKPTESLLLKCGNYFAELLQYSGNGEMEVIAIHLYPDILREIYKNETPSVFKKTNHKSSYTIENSGIINHYIESLNFYFDHPSLVNDELLTLKIRELVLLLLQTGNANTISELILQLFTPTQFHLKEIVQAHLFSSLSMDELASLTGLSLSTFKRKFQGTFNDSPANYIRNKRMEEAQKLLVHSELSVSEICYQVGFSDLSAFTKTFKKHTGFSPMQFKSKQKKKIAEPK